MKFDERLRNVVTSLNAHQPSSLSDDEQHLPAQAGPSTGASLSDRRATGAKVEVIP
jgi:hypothetical protein